MFTYDYGNARLRVMKSHLLTRKDLEGLAKIKSLEGLIASLTKTIYRSPIEFALARTSGLECIISALQDDLNSTVKKVRSFFGEESGEQITILMRHYDVYNIRSILRGVDNNAKPSEIAMTFIPVGDLNYDILYELARASTTHGVIDLMASMNISLVYPLLRLRTEKVSAASMYMELSLEKWYYHEAFRELEKKPEMNLLLSALRMDADITNLLTIVRFIENPSERRPLPTWSEEEGIDSLFVGPGKLSYELLHKVGEQENLRNAVDILANTPYGESLIIGLEVYRKSNNLSDIERQLRFYRLKWKSTLINRDPLGIGVPLGFFALKINEITNLRHIAYGLALELSPEEIISEMAFTT